MIFWGWGEEGRRVGRWVGGGGGGGRGGLVSYPLPLKNVFLKKGKK